MKGQFYSNWWLDDIRGQGISNPCIDLVLPWYSSFSLRRVNSSQNAGWYTSHRSGLSHLPVDNKAAISQMTISNVFLWIKSLLFWFEFHWSVFLRIQLTISHHWLRWWLGAEQATSHYLKQWWPISLMHIMYEALQGDELTHCVWVTLWGATVLLNFLSDNGFLPDNTGPLSGPILT